MINVNEGKRAARLAEAAVTSLGAYRRYVNVIAGGSTARRRELLADSKARAELAWQEAHKALEELAKREGYRDGDRVRIKAGGAFHGAVGVLKDGGVLSGEAGQWHWRLVFDARQTSEGIGPVGSCLVTVEMIEDLPPRPRGD